MKNTNYIKFILVVTESSIIDNRGTTFVTSINNFSDIFEEIEFLKNSIAICINMCDQHREIKHMKSYLKDIFEGNKTLSVKSK